MSLRPLVASTAALLVLAASVAACGVRDTGNDGEAPTVGELIRYGADSLSADPSLHISLEVHRIYGGSTTGRGPLYIPVYLDVANDGSVFVADNGNKNVAWFSEGGELRGTLGGPGQGPGELQQARGVAVSNAAVYALVDWNRINVWDRNGNHLRDVRLPQSRSFMGLSAFDDGTLVSRYVVGSDGPPPASGRVYGDLVIAGYTDDGGSDMEQAHEYAAMPFLQAYRLPPVAHARPIFAVARSGRIYRSTAAAYEISAIDAAAEPLWQLRADVEPPRVTDADIQRAIKAARPGYEFTRESYDWPEYLPALLFLRVDGHGHLYVYRWVRNDPLATVFPVDVFTEDGEHLFSGTIDRKQWLLGRGDLVYGFQDDEASGGRVAVAYRIIEPFD